MEAKKTSTGKIEKARSKNDWPLAMLPLWSFSISILLIILLSIFISSCYAQSCAPYELDSITSVYCQGRFPYKIYSPAGNKTQKEIYQPALDSLFNSVSVSGNGVSNYFGSFNISRACISSALALICGFSLPGTNHFGDLIQFLFMTTIYFRFHYVL